MKTQVFFLRRWQGYMWRNNEHNTLVLWHGNAFGTYYIANRDIHISKIQTGRTVALPCWRWVRERSTILRYKYIAYLFSLRSILILSSDLHPPPHAFQEVTFLQVSTPQTLYAFLCILLHAQLISSWFVRPINISWDRTTRGVLYNAISWILLLFPLYYAQMSSSCFYY